MQRTQSSICNPSRRILSYPADYNKYQYLDIWAFGPHFIEKEERFTSKVKQQFRREVKQKILDRVLDKSDCNFSQLLDGMRNIEEAARAAYEDDALKNLEELDFLTMMAKDGCLFLCLAFTIIGKSSSGQEFCREMNCRWIWDHPCLGLGFVMEKLKMWLHSLFIVGNQIPYVVLDVLMELNFFKRLKSGHEWPLPRELHKRALHQFLMADDHQVRKTKPVDDHQVRKTKPVDLIHSLQLIIVGTKLHPDIPAMKEDSGEIRTEDILPASKLSQLGISFEALEADPGSTGIHCKPRMFGAYLYYPVFRVDEFTELMIQCIRKYEIVQPREINAADASSHFKLLSDLIQTPQDVELLLSLGVIQGQVQGLHKLLMRNCSYMDVSDLHLRRVKREINKYSLRLRWRKKVKPVVKIFVIVSAILVLVNTMQQTQIGISQTIKQLHH